MKTQTPTLFPSTTLFRSLQRLSEWESAFVELQKMFSLTQPDNAMLNEQDMKADQQVQHLIERTERLSQLYSENRR
ncbi:MbeD/MobD family mobilization/exclusion protein [Escherichia coli]|uniref:MbeD/MobD family mobilization/exclusion protein n=1 Tax=Escherichia coli TaxID=562 RepID=UPI002FBE5881